MIVVCFDCGVVGGMLGKKLEIESQEMWIDASRKRRARCA